MATLRAPGRYQPPHHRQAQLREATTAIIQEMAGGRRRLRSGEFYGSIASGDRRRLYNAFDSLKDACNAAGVKYVPGRKWDEKTIRRELAKAHGKRYPPHQRAARRAGGELTFQQYLRAHELPLYSAIQDNYALAAAQMGVSRFHAACLDAGLEYASIVARSRSPK